MTRARDDVERGRACYDRREWAGALEALVDAERAAPLDRTDLDRIVWAAALVGDDDAFLRALERLHQASVEVGDAHHAARAAFWIGVRLLSIGAPGQATGWLARAERHVERAGGPCAERGYLLLPAIVRHLGCAENAEAARLASDAAEIGEACSDADLVALARNLQGRALLRQARVEPGLALLDEVMLAVTSGELSPMVTGIVYCNVIATCQQMHAVDRASEWTSALARWCDEQPQMITFTGSCLVHRAEIMQLGGAWRDAMEQVRLVVDRVCKEDDPEVFGSAWYQRAELLRLRGSYAEAEAAYRHASEHGHDPQPGLALLRLAQGRTADAASAIDRVLASTTAPWQRARMLPAYVEIMLGAGQLDDARRGAAELEDIAREFDTEILGAMAAHARAASLLADGSAMSAIAPLRRAFGVWSRVGAPYIAARIRVLLGRACRAVGDHDGAELELDAARQTFARLGAAPAVAAVEALLGGAAIAPEHGLSPRELEVLRLVASGKTNKAIARELFVSERTIDRHVSNIFTKLDVSSRAAATAYAYEHGLV